MTPSDHSLLTRPRRRRLVAVIGKIAPQAKCNKDQDATPVTTVRAKRVKITG